MTSTMTYDQKHWSLLVLLDVETQFSAENRVYVFDKGHNEKVFNREELLSEIYLF